MFHVEHFQTIRRPEGYESPQLSMLQACVLTMQAQQHDQAEDNRGEEYLYDVVVENLLVGVGSIGDIEFFLSGCFTFNDWIDGGRLALLCVDVHDSPYSRHKVFLGLRAQTYSWGVPLFLRV